ncbi:uncharacterized protein F54H12.2-like [Uloborus diversus]|uniref:uncharacterized protein F54H12.2-like n=1 Tax=Uloborus diversus TaxID=327109 RepID=UPI00240A5EF5|nr:uncharacterized protein F54H12.2-like [Uloborus diversus]
MAFILKGSPECVKSELELFHLPATQTAIENGQWVEYHPLSNLFDGGPVEFHVSGSGEEYIDLSQTQLYVNAKIVKTDGSPIAKDAKIGPVNLFLHSLFSQVDVSLNENLISNSSNTYPYRSYIETLLNHGFDSKTSQLTSEMYYKNGLKKRSSFLELSASVDMIGRIHSDLFHQERLLLNLVDVKIKLIRSKPEFCLQGDKDHKVILEKISLLVRKVKVSPGVILGHVKALEKDTAKYPINRVLCKAYSVPQGSMSMVQDNIFIGSMPRKLIIGCIENDAFHGTFEKSPFDFKHFNMNFIGVYVDGQPKPYAPLELNFDKNIYIKGYNSLFSVTEKLSPDQGIFMSREEYINGNTLFAFNLSPDLCNGDHLNLIKHSNLRLEIKFSQPLSQTKLYQELKDVEFHEGLPPNINRISNSLIVIDDLMNELSCDDRLSCLFTKGSHHRNVSVIFIVQNMFHKGKEMRNISLNAHYIFLFKNPRDRSQIAHLGRQLYPNKSKFFQEVYEDATSRPFSYLLIDLKPDTDESLRLRTGLIPGDKYCVYQPR